ncbi:hypothetical protein FHG87_002444 [Trinorchestia longiramus]|nr:hypothetical protein FHG87_002444 [Trinorchestia longiramus]
MLLLALVTAVAVCTAPTAAFDLTMKLSDLSLDQLNDLVSSEMSALVRSLQSSYDVQKNYYFSNYKKIHHQAVLDHNEPHTRIARSIDTISLLKLLNDSSNVTKSVSDLIQSFSSKQDFEKFAQLLHAWPHLESRLKGETTKPPDEFDLISSITEADRKTTVSSSRTTHELRKNNHSIFEPTTLGLVSEFPDENSTLSLLAKNFSTTLPLSPRILETTTPTSDQPDVSYFERLSSDPSKNGLSQIVNTPRIHGRKATDNIEALEQALSSHDELNEIVKPSSPVFARSSAEGEQEPWHAYAYNTGLYDRERLIVEDVSSVRLPRRQISKMFPISIGDALLATSCACCVPGGCPCEGGLVCAPCDGFLTPAGSPHCTPTDAKVRMDVAAAYQEHGQTTVIAAATGDRVALYRSITSGSEATVETLGTATMNSAILSWHCFLNLGQPFLVLSGPDKATLFSVIDNKIVETQVLRAVDAGLRRNFFDSVLPVDSGNYRGDAALLLSSLGDIRPYTWHPHALIFRPANVFFPALLSEWATHGVLQGSDFTKVMGASGDGSLEVVTVRFAWTQTTDPVLTQYHEARTAVALLQERLAGQHAVLRSVLDRLKHSVDRSSSIEGNISVRGVVETEEARAQKLSFVRASVTNSNNQRLSFAEHQKKLEDEELALDDISDRLQKLRNKFENGIEQHSLEATVDGRIFFTGLSASLVDATSFISDGSELQDIVCDLVEAKNPLRIAGKKVFRGPVRTTSLQTTALDTVPINEFFTETSDVILENVTYVQGLTVLDSFEIVDGFKFGGKQLSKSFLTSDNAVFSSCFFQDVHALGKVSSFRNEVNGVDLQTFSRSILTNQRDVTISGSLQFLNEVIVKGDVTSPLVMGVNMIGFFANVLMKNANERFNSSVQFASPLEISGNVYVNGRVNGHYFPLEYPHNGYSFGIFENKFFENIHVENLTVQGNVDGLRTEDIVTLSTNQIIPGHKVFSSGMEVDGDLNVNNFVVDGVNLQTIGTEAGRKKVDHFTYKVVFHSSVVLKSLNLNGMLNSFDFFDVARDLVLKTDTNVEIHGKKLFEGGLSVNRINTATINYLPVESFINIDQPLSVSGHKTFTNGFTASDLKVDGYIGDVNLTNILQKSLYINKAGQKVISSKIFRDTLSGSLLSVEETINDIDFTNVATKSGNNTFNNEQSFSVAVFDSINSSNVFLQTQFINGIDIGALNSTAMYMDSVQNISGSITCTGNVIFESFLKVEQLNGFPLNEFLPNLVTESESSWLHSDLIIDQIEVRGNIFTKNKVGFSNVNISKLNEEAIKLDAEVLDSEGLWENLTFLAGVLFNGPVNDRMLPALFNDSVFFSEDEELQFSGTKTFSGSVEVSGNVSAVNVNGLHLPTEAFTKTTPQLVTGAFQFASMRVENITFAGLFNGLNVGDLLSTRLVADVELQGRVTLTSDTSVGSLDVDGFVDGVDVVRLLEDLILVNDTGVEVTGEKTSFNSSYYHELFVDDLNGENFDVMADDLVKADEDNHFDSSFRVTNVTSSVIIAESIVVNGFVEGERPGNILNDLVYLNKREVIHDKMTFEHLQIGQKAFEAELSVESLNGRSPLEDFLLTDTVQSFSQDVAFVNLTTKDIIVDKFVNGWKLDRLQRSLKKDFTFDGHSLSTLSSMAQRVEDMKERTQPSIQTFKETYVDECHRGSAYVDVLMQTRSRPSSVRQVSSIHTPASAVQPLLLQRTGVTYLFVPPPPNSCDVTLHRWTDTTASFQPWVTIRNLGVVTDWIELKRLNSTLVAVAVSGTSSCSNASSIVLRVSDDEVEILQAIQGWDSVSWTTPSGPLGPPVLRLGSPSTPRGHVHYAFSEDSLSLIPVPHKESHQRRIIFLCCSDWSTGTKIWAVGLPTMVAWARSRDKIFYFGINDAVSGRVEADVVDASIAVVGNRSVAVAMVLRSAPSSNKPYVMQILRSSLSEPGFELQDSVALDHRTHVTLVTTDHPYHFLVVTTDATSSPRLHWIRGSGQLSQWHRGELQLETSHNATWSDTFKNNGTAFLTILSSLNSGDILSVHEIVVDKTSKLKRGRKISCPLPKLARSSQPQVPSSSVLPGQWRTRNTSSMLRPRTPAVGLKLHQALRSTPTSFYFKLQHHGRELSFGASLLQVRC